MDSFKITRNKKKRVAITKCNNIIYMCTYKYIAPSDQDVNNKTFSTLCPNPTEHICIYPQKSEQNIQTDKAQKGLLKRILKMLKASIMWV